jgi:hypothetical protein
MQELEKMGEAHRRDATKRGQEEEHEPIFMSEFFETIPPGVYMSVKAFPRDLATGKGAKASGLTLVSVLFPAPWAPAIRVKTGLSPRERCRAGMSWLEEFGSDPLQDAGDPLPALL